MKYMVTWSVYELAFRQQRLVFEISQKLPPHESYNLSNQVLRSSRSICANLAEAYRKGRYPQHVVLKLTDADAENAETSTWLDIIVSCNYIKEEDIVEIRQLNTSIGKLLHYMINNPEKYSRWQKPDANC